MLISWPSPRGIRTRTAAEQALLDAQTRIRDIKRRARTAETVEEQKHLREDLKVLERQQRKQRQDVVTVEGQIEAKRDQLMDALKRLEQKMLVRPLLGVRWGYVIFPIGKIVLAVCLSCEYIPERE